MVIYCILIFSYLPYSYVNEVAHVKVVIDIFVGDYSVCEKYNHKMISIEKIRSISWLKQ
jgi:hypothetical protein